MVLVLDKRKKPLMPRTPKRAGLLLARGEQTEEGEVHHALLLAAVAHRGEQVHRHKVTQAQARRRRRCVYYGKTAVPFEVDHIRPRSRGGSHRISSLCLACHACNQAKGDKTATEFGHPEVEAQAKTPLKDAAAVRAGRLRTLDITATGRGDHCRTLWTDKGFPRGYKLRRKMVVGFATGDRVRAVVPETLKTAGTHVGRVAVRTSRSFAITTGGRKVDGIHARYCVLIQRGDGYEYALTQQVGKWSLSSPRPPKKEPLLPPLTQAKGSPQLEIRS